MSLTKAAASHLPLPVLIIGSGLGGLTLAHALRAHGIPYRLFERDSALDDRAQGYRISIDEGGASALKSALASSPGLFEQFEQSCAESHPPGGRVDAVSGVVLGKGVLGLLGAGGVGMFGELGKRWIGKRWERIWQKGGISAGAIKVPQSAKRSYQVDRRVLRNLLLSSQTEHITHSASFQSYTLPADGKSVIAHFANGTSVPGYLLVGADGVRSNVAAQLLASAANTANQPKDGDKAIRITAASPRDMGVRIIYGKTPLSTVDKNLHETLRKGTSFVVDRPGGLLLVQECMRFNLPDSPDDYVFWALSGQKNIFDRAEVEIGSIKASEVAEYLTKGWDPSIRVIMEKQDIGQTAGLRMMSSSTEGTARWETERRVTVLGDAVHCMPPTGGQGANAALHDAALLGLVLGQAEAKRGGGTDEAVPDADSVRGEDGWDVGTIRTYEEGMRENIGDVVGMACIGAKRILGAIGPS